MAIRVSTTVDDGFLTIGFDKIKQNPKICAIEVHPTDETGSIAPSMEPSALRVPTNLRSGRPSLTPSAVPSFSQVPSSFPSTDPTTSGTSRPVFDPICINAGGGVYTDSSGITWAADKYFLNGKKYVATSSINGTDDDSLYVSERFHHYSQLKYEIPGIPSGTYEVTLLFSENYITHRGGRLFNVSMEKDVVYSKLDIYSEAGGNFTALRKTATVEVSDGALNIVFTKIRQNPKISGIELHAAATAPSGSSSLSAPSLKPTTSGMSGPAPIYINAGGDIYTDRNGITWSAVNYFVNGKKFVATGSINGTDDDDIFLSERYDSILKYEIPGMPSGTHEVTLLFLENYVKNPGDRVFNVSMEGDVVFPKLDIYSEAGGQFTALTKTATVALSDGALNIDFAKIRQNPKVSGIEIHAAATAPVSSGSSSLSGV